MSLFKIFTDKKIFWITFAVIVGGWLAHAICGYFFLGFRVWDTALHVQPVLHWTLYGEYIDKFLHGGVHPFVNHFRPILLLLAPFFYVWKSMLVIHIAKVIAFASCPLIFLYYGKKFGLQKLAFAIPVLWLIHDVLITAMYAGNQATALALPFIVLAFMLAMNKSYRAMWIPLILLLFFKENLSLVWICLGMFLIVEHKKWKLGSLIVGMGLIIGFTIYFVVIPGFTEGVMQHSVDSFKPLDYVGEKMMMLIRAYLAMGFFVFFRPQALLYTLPAYGIYLVGGHRVYSAFFLGAHTHDFPTTILFCAVFYLLFKTVKENSRFKIERKGHRRYLKTCLVIMFLFCIAKNPYFRIAYESVTYPVAHQIRNTVINIRETIKADDQIYVSGAIMDLFIKYRNIHPFALSHGHHRFPYLESESFTIIFPTHSKLSLLKSDFLNHYIVMLQKHDEKGLCDLNIYNESEENEVFVVNYNKPLPKTDQAELMAFFDQY